MKQKFFFVLLILALQFLTKEILNANTVQYISPKPGSINNMENTNIIIGYSETLNINLINVQQIKVTGSLSGIHSGKLVFAEKNSKIIFKVDSQFAFGENVTVSGIKNVNDFSFFIRATKPVLPDNFYRDISLTREVINVPYHRDILIRPDSLPEFTIYNSGSTAGGYLFISNFSNVISNSILMMLNNDGSPNFARTLLYKAYDFKKQNDNLITYYYEIGHKFWGLNTSYNVVDSFESGNGYTTDFHELVVMADGSAWLMSYDAEYIDMSVVVVGGKTNALVTGLIIQKIDAQKNVVFQWRSWDNFQITDATHENLTSYNIDYVHGNAIDVDYDGNILLSSRHLDEITKINSETGDIIWRLGGTNNEFTFVNDTLGFSHQHCVRKLPNGHIMLFDNGNYHSPAFSRVVEYKIDEDEKIVEIAWEFRHNPSIYAVAMGSVQRLSNGNTLIGWGSASTTLTEVTPNGTVAYELSLPAGQMSYRAFRDEWGTISGGQPTADVTPSKFVLYQNYPNPFNPTTNIKYQLAKNSNVTLKIYDMLGKEVATLVNEFQKAGTYEKQFSINLYSGNVISSGIYFCRIQTEDFADTKKMLLIK
jgi:hypothetical protein